MNNYIDKSEKTAEMNQEEMFSCLYKNRDHLEIPSVEIDNFILQQAAEFASQKKEEKTNIVSFRTSWIKPFSLAASFVLCISVVLLFNLDDFNSDYSQLPEEQEFSHDKVDVKDKALSIKSIATSEVANEMPQEETISADENSSLDMQIAPVVPAKPAAPVKKEIAYLNKAKKNRLTAKPNALRKKQKLTRAYEGAVSDRQYVEAKAKDMKPKAESVKLGSAQEQKSQSPEIIAFSGSPKEKLDKNSKQGLDVRLGEEKKTRMSRIIVELKDIYEAYKKNDIKLAEKHFAEYIRQNPESKYGSLSEVIEFCDKNKNEAECMF